MSEAFYLLVGINVGVVGSRMMSFIVRARSNGLSVREAIAPKRGDRRTEPRKVTEVS